MDPLLPEHLITTKSASELSGYTSDYLSRLIRSGKISGKKIGHSWLIDSVSLESFLNSQKSHNLDRARELAEARAKEYRTHRSLIRRVRNDLTKATSGAESVLGPVSIQTHAFALSLAIAIVTSGAVVARAGVLQAIAGQAAHVALEAVSGFDETFGTVPSHIAVEFSGVKSDVQARPSVIAERIKRASSKAASPVLAEPDLSFMRMSTECEGTSCARHARVIARASRQENYGEAISLDLSAVVREIVTLASSPANLGDMLAQAYAAIGDGAYVGIDATFGLYRKGIEQSGRTAFGLAVETRDVLSASPRVIASVARSYVNLTHAAIDAEVAGAYGIAAAAPASAHLVVDILGTSGSMLAYAASRTPAVATSLYLAVAEMPYQVAPKLAQAVFAAEYAGAERFVSASHSIADAYLSFVTTTGRLAYDRSAKTQQAFQSAASVLASAPASIQDAYLRTIGQTAVAVDALTHIQTLAASITASYPSLSIGERAAVTTYGMVQGFFGSLTRNLAFLFAPAPTVVLVNNAPTRATSTTPATLATPAAPGTSYSYPTYTTTTVVQGVSPATLERSLSSLRSDILGSVSGMIRPVASQTATNQTTIQYVNMIQDLTGLIVRNGDFRGGIFDSGSLTNGFSVSASEGTFGSLTAGSTTLAKTSITGNLSVGDNFIYDVITSRLGLGTTSPFSKLSIAGSPGGTENILAISTSTAGFATSTVLTIDQNGDVALLNGANLTAGGNLAVTGTADHTGLATFRNGFLSLASSTITSGLFSMNGGASTTQLTTTGSTYLATAGGNVGIGTTSPYSKLSVWGSGTGATALFELTNSASTTLASVLNDGTAYMRGKLGIGTTSPTYKFSVEGSSTLGNQAIAGYFTATSTTATSTFAGFIDVNGTGANATSTFASNLWVKGTLRTGTGSLFMNDTGLTSSDGNLSLQRNGISYLNGGNLGIGTTSPYSRFSVWGTGTGATSLFELTNSASTTLASVLNDGTAYMRGNLGIGTTSPYRSLSVNGSGVFTGGDVLSSTLTATSSISTPSLTLSGIAINSLLSTDGSGVIAATSTPTFGNFNATSTVATSTISTGGLAIGGSQFVVQQTSGNVGIGTANPQGNLDVSGVNSLVQITGSNISSLQFSSPSSFANINTYNDGTLRFQSSASSFNSATNQFVLASGGNIGVGTSSPWAQLSVNPNGITGPAFVIGSSTATNFIVSNNGYVGIGTTSPSSALAVSGNLMLGGTTGTILTGSGAGITFTGAGNHDITAAGGTLRLGSNTIIGNIEALNDTIDIGTPSTRFDMVYANEVNATTLVGTIVGGNVSAETLTVNSDNVTADAENSYLVFERGTISPNATLTWNAAGSAKRFELNQPLFIQNASASTTLTTFDLKSVTGQTADIFRIASSSGADLLNFTAAGNLGIGTTSPYRSLSVNGSAVFTGGDVLASTLTATSTITSSATTTATHFAASTLGFAGAPAFTFSSDLNTGLWSPTADTLALSTAGSERLRVDSSGNVGIGTSSPWGLLSVNPNGITGPAFVVGSSTKTDFVVTNAGNVGIGTTSPTNKLWVEGTGATPATLYRTTAASNVSIEFKNNDRSWFAGQASTGNFAVGSNANIGATNSFFNVTTAGNVGIGTTSPFAKLSIHGADGETNKVLFAIASSTASATTTHFLVANTGNVGIGTGAPSSLLHLMKNTGILMLDTSSASSQFNLNFADASTNKWAIYKSAVNNLAIYDYTKLGDVFSVSSNGNMSLTPTGNVGVGTTSPFAKLSIHGANGETNRALFAIASSTASATTTHFVVTNEGNVGIGTTTPSFASGSGLNITNATRANLKLDASAFSNSLFTDSNGGLYINNNTAAATNFIFRNLASGGESVRIDTNGNVGIGTTSPASRFSVQGNALVSGTGFFGGAVTATSTLNVTGLTTLGNASTTQIGSTGAAYFATSGGSVGIGTTSPTNLLSISSNTNSIASIDSTLTSGSSRLYFTESGTLKNYFQSLGSAFATTERQNDLEIISNSGDISFLPGAVQSLTLKGSGNVGIGTTSPYRTLSVKGSGVFTGGDVLASTLTATSTITSSATTTATHFAASTLGFAGAPAFTFSDDLNTGLWSPTADTLALSTGGSERLRVDSSGNVGIGTTTPTTGKLVIVSGDNTTPQLVLNAIGGNTQGIIHASADTGNFEIQTGDGAGAQTVKLVIARTTGNVGIGTTSPWGKLSVTNTGTGPSFVVEDSTSPDATPFIIDASGNVGIGTAVPGSALHVSGIAGSTLSLDRAGVSSKRFNLFVGDGSIGTTLDENYIKSLNTGLHFLAGPTGSTEIVTMQVDGNVGIGTTSPYAQLSIATPNGATGSQTTLFAIASSTQAGATTTLMSVLANGNVGIGTASPSRTLSISAAEPSIQLTSGFAGGQWEFIAGNGVGATAGDFVLYNAGYGNTPIRITNDAGNLNNNALVIKSGNVGIGTTSPSALFSIGNGLTSGGYYFTSTGLGIGRANPLYPLDVNGLARVAGYLIGVDSSSNIKYSFTNDGGASYIDSGNFGIGTTTPDNKLTVLGNVRSSSGFYVGDYTGNMSGGFINESDTSKSLTISADPGNAGVASFMRFNVDGSERVRIDSSGNVGIGTTTPNNLLDIYSTSKAAIGLSGASGSTYKWTIGMDVTNGGRFSIASSTALGTTDRFVIDGNGNVGIGTANPNSASKLHIDGSNALIYTEPSADDGQLSGIRTLNSSGAIVGRITTNTLTGEVAVGSANANYFTTLYGGTTERVRVTTTGNVGIGTTSPSQKLHVYGSGAQTILVESNNSNAATYALRSATADASVGLSGNVLTIAGGSGDSIPVALNASNVSNQLYLATTGNIGIGTTSPATKLSIGGSGNLALFGDDTSAHTYLGFAGAGGYNNGRSYVGYNITSGNTVLQGASGKGIEFNVNNSTFGSGTAAVITTTGNVGIGTTTPVSLLTFKGGGVVGSGDGDYYGLGAYYNGGWKNTQNGQGGSAIRNSAGVFTIFTGENTGEGGSSFSSFTEKFRISGTGNVGIGTSSPTAKLTITTGSQIPSSSGDSVNGVLISSSSGGSSLSLGIKDTGVSGTQYGWLQTAYTNTASAVGYLALNPLGGNVGIGTTTPGTKLDVNGIFRALGLPYASQVFPSSGVGFEMRYQTDYDALANNNTGGTGGSVFQSYDRAGAGSWKDLIIKGQNVVLNANNSGNIVLTGGNVGIGTTTPDNLLSIKGSGLGSTAIGQLSDATTYGAIGFTPVGVLATTNYALAGTQALTLINAPTAGAINFRIGNTNKVVIDTNGNVGIGTTTPSATLTVSPYGSSIGTPTNGATSFVAGTGPNGDALGLTAGSYLYPFEYQASTGNILRFQTTPYRRVAGSDWKGAAYRMQLAVDNSFTDGSKAYIEVGASDPSTTTGGGFIALGTAGSDRLVVNNAGNVGIGTTSPSSLLHIAGSTGSTLNTILEPAGWLGLKHRFGVQYSGDTSAISNNALLTSATAGTLDNTAQSGSALILGSSGSLNYVVASAGSGTRTFSSRLFIGSSGNVGIGTTTPTTRLDILSTNNTSQIRLSDESTDATIKDFILSGRHYTNTEEDFAVLNARSDSTANTIYIGGEIASGLSPAQNAATDIVFKTAANNTTTVGSERMRITSSGNVGIGTTTPNNLLDIYSTSKAAVGFSGASGSTYKWTIGMDVTNGGRFSIASSTALGTTDRFVIDGNGNVGIGTTGPSGKLSLGIDGTGVGLKTWNTASQATLDAYTISGAPYTRILDISAIGSGEGTAGGGSIRFITNPVTNTTGVERMRISTDGNVGIGTTEPGAKLEVIGNQYITNSLTSDNTTNAWLSLIKNSNKGWSIGNQLNGSSRDLVFNNDTNGAGTNFMVIQESGNIGIGTTSPANKLQIGSVGSSEYGGNDLAIGNGTQVMAFYNNTTAATWYTNTNFALMPSGSGSTGNVGIGTTSPTALLHLSDASSAKMNFEKTGTSAGISTIYDDGAFNINSRNTLWLRPGGTANVLIAPTSGNVGIGTTSPYSLLSVSNSATTAANVPLFTIASTTGGTSTSTLMSVLANGNVGIGEAAPTWKFVVKTAAQSVDGIQIVGTDSHYVNLRASMGSGNNNPIVQAGDTGIIYTNGNVNTGAFTLAPWSDSLAGLRMTAVGYVGIGVSNPGSLLSIASTTATGTSGLFSIASSSAILNVLANGNVGIGVAVPGAKLAVQVTPSNDVVTGLNSDAATTYRTGSGAWWHVGKNATLDALQFSNGATPGATSNMVILNSGNVGIGTTTPAAGLQVVYAVTTAPSLTWGATSGQILRSENSEFAFGLANASPYPLYMQGRQNTGAARDISMQPLGGNVLVGATVNNVYDQVAGARPLVVQKSDTSTTLGGSTAAITVVNGDTTTNNTAQLNFAAITGASTNQYSGAIISAIFGARTNAQYPSGQLAFLTSTATNFAPTEKMRIDNNGNVGIGVTSPLYKLSFATTTTDARYAPLIAFSNTTNPRYTVGLGSSHTTGVGQALNFYAGDSGGNTTELGSSAIRMSITGAGNVGIGTTSPIANFQVSGGAGIYTTMQIGGSATASDNFHFVNENNGSNRALRLYNGNVGAGTQVMTVLSGGNVGIGVTAPRWALDVVGTGSATTSVDSAANSGTSALGLFHVAGATNQQKVAIISDATGTWGRGNLRLAVNIAGDTSNVSAADTRLYIDGGTGYVGIGTTTPSALLSLYQNNNSTTIGNKQKIFLENDSVTGSAGGELVFGTGDVAVERYAAIGTSIIGNDGATGSRGSLYFATKSASADTTLTERLTILNTGNVGIGTTTPDKTLSVNGAAQLNVTSGDTRALFMRNLTQSYTYAFKIDTNKFKISDESAGYERLTLDSAGNVGIGTTTPSDGLVIQQTSANKGLTINNTVSYPQIIFQVNGATKLQQYTDSSIAYFESDTSGGLSFRTGGANDRVKIDQNGNVGIGTTTPFSRLSVTGAGTGTGRGLSVANSSNVDNFYVLDNGNAYMKGNVGIGTTTPIKQLTLKAPASNYAQFALSGGDTLDYWNLYAFNTNASFNIAYDGTTPLMTVLNSGNLGIGTANPGAKLEVYGGAIKVNGLSTSATVIDLSAVDDAVIQGGVNTQIRMGGNLTLTAGNVMPFSTNGTERMRLQNSGGLSFGSTYAGTDPGANNVIIEGNVGIGTTESAGKLAVVGTVAKTSTTFERLASFRSSEALASNPLELYIGQVGNAVAASQAISLQTGHYGADFSANLLLNPDGGNVGIGTTSPSARLHLGGATGVGLRIENSTLSTNTYITNEASSVSQYNASGQSFKLVTGSGVNAIFADTTGNVGIGTTTPNSKLVVLGGVGAAGAGEPTYTGDIRLIGNSGGSQTLAQNGGLEFKAATGGAGYGFRISNPDLGNAVTPLVFEARTGSATWNEMMRITNTGNLGLGTTSPYALLSISGTAGQTKPFFAIASSTNASSAPFFQVASSTAFIIDGGVTQPTHKGSGTAVLGAPVSVFVSGDYAYVLESAESNKLEIFDVSDPGNPSRKGSLTVATGGVGWNNRPNAIFVSGNYAYFVTAGAMGLQIADVSDPNAPVIKGSVTISAGNTHSVYVSGNYAYVTAGSSLVIVDVSNPGSPVIKGSLSNGVGGALLSSAWGVSVSGNYAYVVSLGSSALEIVDISNPASPTHKGSLSNGSGGALLSSPTGIFISGNYAYIAANGSNALEIVDISNPASPTHKGSLSNGSGGALLSSPIGVFVSGNYAYVASGGSNALEIVDVSNPASPTHKSSLSGALLTLPQSVFVSGNYAYVAPNTTKLEVIDIGGAYIANQFVGSSKIGTLQVQNLAQFNQNVLLKSGLSVGGNSLINGGLSISGSIASTSLSSVPSLNVSLADTNTSSLIDVANLLHMGTTTTNRGANGIGTGLLFSAGNTSGTTTAIARVASIFTAAGGTATTSVLTFSTLNGNTLSEKARLDHSGNLGIGTTSPATLLEVGGVSANVTFDFYKNCTGFTSNENGLLACTASDQRLKQGVVALGAADALAGINELNPVSFYWNPATERGTGQQFGLIAQEVQTVFPNLVAKTSPTELTPDGTLVINYEGLVSPIISAIQQLDARTKFFENAATSTVLTADVAGNLGIGSTSPSSRLSVNGGGYFTDDLRVEGDVSAIGFVNISTRSAKKDISYATASSSEERLTQLKNLKIATYRYTSEADTDPLRLGFIAEEAQIVAPEILSVGGKGVDLYKLATFMLSGVQALAAKMEGQDTRITSLESRMAALESGAVSAASGSPLTLSTTSLASALEGFGVFIQKGIAQFNTLVFRQLVASKDADGTSSAGSVTIITGNTVAQVNNSLVKASTKVFVTFNSQIAGSWWVSDKTDSSFRVVLSGAQPADVSFDYFLVQTEGQLAATGAAASVIQSNGPDTTAPVITLLGDNPMRISIGGTFAEPGVTVTDDVDGTDPYVTYVNGLEQAATAETINTSSQTTYIITYRATDAAGNSSTITRSVIIGNPDETVTTTTNTSTSTPPSSDTTAPVVVLSGDAALQLTVGDTFADPGATATDDVDGSLTAVIAVSGAVDTATAGNYTLIYSATDAAGNTGSASRLVSVVAPSPEPTPAPEPVVEESAPAEAPAEA